MSAAEPPPAAGLEVAASRRRLGSALVAFGIAGLVILGLLAFVILGPAGSLGTAAGTVDAQRTRAVALLPSAVAALDSAAVAATNAGASLHASGQSAQDGAALLVQLASSMDGMSAASQIDILGARPFGALSGQLASVAERSRNLAGDLSAAATAIDANVSDSGTAAARLHDLSVEVDQLRAALASGGPAGAGAPAMSLGTEIAILRLLLLLLVLWLAGPAIAAIWLGRRWRRGWAVPGI